MRIDEDTLKNNLKQEQLAPVYYFYGKEAFLVKTYTARVTEKSAPEADDFNIIKFSGLPDVDSLEESIETLPVFADKKVVMINDLDAEKTDINALERVIELFSDIPDFCTVIISITGFEPNIKNAKTKKLLTCIEKKGIVCEFELLSRAKAAQLIIKKASRLNCVISRQNAEILYDLTLGSLTLIGLEIEKLCAYTDSGGEITKETINLLTPRQPETSIYDLAAALTAKNAKNAFQILDDLMVQRCEPVMILASLSGAFTDCYRAKLGQVYTVPPEKTAVDFNYPKNRAWVLSKTARTVTNISLETIKKYLLILYKADIKLKSVTLNGRTVIEKSMAEILIL
ncbi:MAG: DNA polymerase III subunit delta [Oscillospiraceae bacterium]|nr:DNA polymerase III subunit delta [Oscillospiraceae bacterium]